MNNKKTENFVLLAIHNRISESDSRSSLMALDVRVMSFISEKYSVPFISRPLYVCGTKKSLRDTRESMRLFNDFY